MLWGGGVATWGIDRRRVVAALPHVVVVVATIAVGKDTHPQKPATMRRTSILVLAYLDGAAADKKGEGCLLCDVHNSADKLRE